MTFAQQANYAATRKPSNTYFNDDEYGYDMYDREEDTEEEEEAGEDE